MGEVNNKGRGEFELIGWIKEQVESCSRMPSGIGDDCAIDQLPSDQQLLTSNDLLIEDIHFNRAWTSMFDLGRKSVAVNLSDIAAMGGKPRSLYLGLGRSQQLEETELKDFIRGFLYEARQHDVVLAGGDTCGSPGPLMISVTVQGLVPTGKAVMRQGSGCGDALYVSGTLGDSALALHLLRAGQMPPVPLAQRFHTPSARIDLGRLVGEQELATAMLDVSDGLLADLNHLLVASGVGAELILSALPLSEAFRSALGQNPSLIDLALAGGEDYELLFSSARHDLEQMALPAPGVVKVGHIRAGTGINIRQDNGDIYHCRQRGFDHFAAS
ncbi:thiamine-phosphate kinase [Pelovirga terrestris]|uniref:Thiamine-monophosphate kinase n=1 Tax=Pelovirga terrestris TaxID=2771352 RepID=A0A8J6QQG2_9BACT|nr:thiamine-phosphate kinase [Pelovirga terrestris]MBD1399895.1 thiamine-phosphate kinase [Pelovirga terrestris]